MDELDPQDMDQILDPDRYATEQFAWATIKTVAMSIALSRWVNRRLTKPPKS